MAGTREQQDAATLEAIADAAWSVGELDECIAARDIAYKQFEADGDARGTARSAIALYDYFCFKGRRAVANGWLQRAKRSLDGQPDAPEHGLLLEREAEVAHGSGALELALEKAGRALDIGRRCPAAAHTSTRPSSVSGNVRVPSSAAQRLAICASGP